MSDVPQVSASDIAAFEELARRPEDVWRIQSERMPEMMARVDVMLIAGMTPEWILNRDEWHSIPVEVQTVFINALHWRQERLKNGTDV